MNLMNTQNLMVASKYNLLKGRKYKVLSIDTEKGGKSPQKRQHLQQFISLPVLICTFLIGSCP